MSFETISVIGLGYIGLPTAAILAARKKMVIGVDVRQSTVDTVNRGDVHIVEPDLDIVVRSAVAEGYLRATTQPEPADAFLIAVPTPFTGDHQPDLTYIKAAAQSIAPVLKRGDLVILESTSPVGTTEAVAAWLADARPDLAFPQAHGEVCEVNVAYCPERVLPGRVLRELVDNDRVIGGMTSECSRAASELYKTFVKGECVVTNSRTAEMCKLTENSFRDVNIAFANELSVICDNLEINVWELITLANRHPRVGILQPGPGVGGHCIAVDPWFIVSSAPKEAELIRTARKVNDRKPRWVIDRVESLVLDLAANACAGRSPVSIACLGLAFKANIDDLRCSPALAIAQNLGTMYPGQVIAVEPNISELPKDISNDVSLVALDDALSIADIVVLLVDHSEFRSIELPAHLRQRVVDTRGIFS